MVDLQEGEKQMSETIVDSHTPSRTTSSNTVVISETERLRAELRM